MTSVNGKPMYNYLPTLSKGFTYLPIKNMNVGIIYLFHAKYRYLQLTAALSILNRYFRDFLASSILFWVTNHTGLGEQ